MRDIETLIKRGKRLCAAKEYKNPDYGEDDELTDQGLRSTYRMTPEDIKKFRRFRREGMSERDAIYKALGQNW